MMMQEQGQGEYGKKQAMLSVLKNLITLMRKKAGSADVSLEMESKDGEDGQEQEGENGDQEISMADASPDKLKQMIKEAEGGDKQMEVESDLDPEELKSFFMKDESKRPTAKHGMRVGGLMAKMSTAPMSKPMGKMKK